MRKQRFLFVAILSLGLVPRGTAFADPIRIDQVSPIAGGIGGLGCCISENWAQTFTVGMTGVLRTVALPLSRPLGAAFPDVDDFSGQLGIQLRPTVGGVPGESVLAEMILTKSSLPSVSTPGVRNEFTTFFSGLNIPIVEGQQLAIVLRNVAHNGQNIRWALNAEASYTRGAAYRQPREETGMAGEPGNVTGPWGPAICCPDFDFGFFTEVEAAALPAATPEPGTVLLLGTGLVWLARRRTCAGPVIR